MLLAAPLVCGAYETDQFSNRLQPIADSATPLNDKINQTIAAAVEDWRGGRNEKKVVNRIFHDIGGHHWVDKLERWTMQSPEIERLKTPRRDSIYAGHPFWATRVAAIFGVGPTIKINGVLVGSDKLGHFLSQGRKFYGRYVRYQDVARAAERSAFTERAIFGQLTTGSYSNADLVANYEGYVFYRSLFDDGAVPGKPAILRWEAGHWVVQRAFDFADHVNEYWDEALNINHYDGLLYPHIKERLKTFCPEYYQAPAMYDISDEERLIQRYRHLQLRPTSDLRLANICPTANDSRPAVTTAGTQPLN